MRPSNAEVYFKCSDVIQSCKTLDQCDLALRYCCLASRHLNQTRFEVLMYHLHVKERILKEMTNDRSHSK